MALAALIARKEEGAVLDDRTANAVSVDVAVERYDRARRVEIVLRVEPLVAQELVSCPMQAVAAGLRYRVDHDPGVASILGVKRVGLHLEFLDHVDVRLKGDLVLHRSEEH